MVKQVFSSTGIDTREENTTDGGIGNGYPDRHDDREAGQLIEFTQRVNMKGAERI